MTTRIEGYLLIPHELLHSGGSWLVGKRCIYRLGDKHVAPIGPLTRNERLVGLLFPFVACIAAWLILLPMPIAALFYGGVTWAIVLAVLLSVPLLYAFTSIGDFRQAYLLILDKPQGSKTPFDILFWPVMKEHTKGLHTSSLIILLSLVLIYLYFLLFL